MASYRILVLFESASGWFRCGDAPDQLAELWMCNDVTHSFSAHLGHTHVLVLGNAFLFERAFNDRLSRKSLPMLQISLSSLI